MHNFSIWHWLILAVVSATALIPGWLIVRKAGYPGFLSLLAWVPLVNIILLWVFALSTWPVEKK